MTSGLEPSGCRRSNEMRLLVGIWRGNQVTEGLTALAEIMEYRSYSSGKPFKNFMQRTDY